MPKQPSSKGSKKQKRDDKSDSEDSDGGRIEHIHFFVPGERINAAVLVDYITQYIDRTAKTTATLHPTDKSRVGFTVRATKSLATYHLRDIISDSKDWDTETQSRKFKQDPYDYRSSETARRRAHYGPTNGDSDRPQPRQTTSDPRGNQQEKAISPPVSSGQGQVQYAYHPAGQQQPHEYQRTSAYPGSGRGDPGSHTYNISNTTISYSANVPQNPAHYGQGQFQTSGGYAQVQKAESDYQSPPPPYQTPPARPQPGGPQPGGGTFDSMAMDDKPRISQNVPTTTSRQGSVNPREEYSRSHGSQDRRPSTFDEPQRRR